MPGANEILPLNIFYLYSFPKMYEDPFSHLPKFLTFSHQFSNFLGCPSQCCICPGNDIFLFFFSHLPTFFTKTMLSRPILKILGFLVFLKKKPKTMPGANEILPLNIFYLY